MNISVAIVEDNNDIRQALEQIIEMSDGYSLAGSCINGEEALLQIPLFKPAIVLMDINLGGISGIEVVKQLKREMPEVLFMMCTIYEEDEKIFDDQTRRIIINYKENEIIEKFIEGFRTMIDIIRTNIYKLPLNIFNNLLYGHETINQETLLKFLMYLQKRDSFKTGLWVFVKCLRWT